MRKKVYDVRDFTPEVADTRRVNGSHDNADFNPLHSRTSGNNTKNNFDANPFSQQSAPGGSELMPIPNLTMPRVFNGDYRQLPITTDDD